MEAGASAICEVRHRCAVIGVTCESPGATLALMISTLVINSAMILTLPEELLLRYLARRPHTRRLHIAGNLFLHWLSAILLTPHIWQLLRHIQGHSQRNDMLILYLKLLLAKLGPDALWKHPEERNQSQWHTLFNLMNYASRCNVLLQPHDAS